MTNLALKLAENARSIGVSSAYGEAVQIEGVTMVPVALVQYGFGAGGQDAGQDTEGQSTHHIGDGFGGGGGGGVSVPIGIYVKHGTSIRFDPNIIALLAVGIPFVWVAGHALTRVIRAIKR